MKKPCKICGKPSKCGGLCRKHHTEYLKEKEESGRKERTESGIKFRTCSREGCDEKLYAKGLCRYHYQLAKRGKKVSIKGMIQKMTLRERLLMKIHVESGDEENSCWEWHGAINMHGYGFLSVNNYPAAAHRIAYQEFIGPIPENMFVCHKCDNRKCINPAHLFLGTTQENTQDMVKKGRNVRGADQYKSILTESDVVRIKKLIRKGLLTNDQIGEKFGVSGWAISRIKCGKNWKHVEI